MPYLAAAGLDVFYPIVPDARWMARIVPLGVRVVQLRLKDASPEEVRSQIRDCIAIAQRHRCQLIINDYWQQAIEEGANYIHLGQEDLAAADEAFLTSSIQEIVPVTTLEDADGRASHPGGTRDVGPMTRQLMQAYRERAEGAISR